MIRVGIDCVVMMVVIMAMAMRVIMAVSVVMMMVVILPLLETAHTGAERITQLAIRDVRAGR